MGELLAGPAGWNIADHALLLESPPRIVHYLPDAVYAHALPPIRLL